MVGRSLMNRAKNRKKVSKILLIKVRSLILLAYSVLLAFSSFAQGELGDRFNQAVEFPNYFLPEDFDQRSNVEQQALLAERRRLLENAVASVLHRLQVPVYDREIPGYRNVLYFDLARQTIREIDAKAKVLPSSGVVRSILGHLYEQMDFHRRSGQAGEPIDVLIEIARDTRPIEAVEVRGVGSDFDLLIQTESPDSFKLIRKGLEAMTHHSDSPATKFWQNTDHKHLMFVILDVKSYDAQTTRSVSEGGSSLDWIAFDLDENRFVEPAPNIVDDFLRGKYRYLAPQPDTIVEDPQKQTIRGIRSLVELPFLSILDESQLRAELKELIETLRRGEDIDPKALRQIGKAIRNGRRSLGNNRILRAGPGSLEELIFELSRELKSRDLPYIPEYAASALLEVRDPHEKSELNGLPSELLTPIGEFLTKHSDGGGVYHGTKSFDNAMAILRGGFFVSGGVYQQGNFGEGSGAYAAKERSEAFEGFVLRLQVREDPRINVLVWDDVESHPFIRDIIQKTESQGIDAHQYLQRHHGVDIIVKSAVLVLNMEVFDLGTDRDRLRRVIEASINSARANSNSELERAKSLRDYFRLVLASEALGLEIVGFEDVLPIFYQFTQNTEIDVILMLMDIFDENPRLIEDFPEYWKEFQKNLRASFQSTNMQELLQISERFSLNFVQWLPRHFLILLHLTHSSALHNLGSLFKQNPDLIEGLPKHWEVFKKSLWSAIQHSNQSDLRRVAIFLSGDFASRLPEHTRKLEDQIISSLQHEELHKLMPLAGVLEGLSKTGGPELEARIKSTLNRRLLSWLQTHDASDTDALAETLEDARHFAVWLEDFFSALIESGEPAANKAVAMLFRYNWNLVGTMPELFLTIIEKSDPETIREIVQPLHWNDTGELLPEHLLSLIQRADAESLVRIENFFSSRRELVETLPEHWSLFKERLFSVIHNADQSEISKVARFLGSAFVAGELSEHLMILIQRGDAISLFKLAWLFLDREKPVAGLEEHWLEYKKQLSAAIRRQDLPELQNIFQFLRWQSSQERWVELKTELEQELRKRFAMEVWYSGRAGLREIAEMFMNSPYMAHWLPDVLEQLMRRGDATSQRSIARMFSGMNTHSHWFKLDIALELPEQLMLLIQKADASLLPELAEIFSNNPDLIEKLPDHWNRVLDQWENLVEREQVANLESILSENPNLAEGLMARFEAKGSPSRANPAAATGDALSICRTALSTAASRAAASSP